MRRTSTLLEILKEEYIKQQDSGLCHKCGYLHGRNIIDHHEYWVLIDVIKLNMPILHRVSNLEFDSKPKMTHGYYWKNYKLAPRLRWLNMLIKRYKRKED